MLGVKKLSLFQAMEEGFPFHFRVLGVTGNTSCTFEAQFVRGAVSV